MVFLLSVVGEISLISKYWEASRVGDKACLSLLDIVGRRGQGFLFGVS